MYPKPGCPLSPQRLLGVAVEAITSCMDSVYSISKSSLPAKASSWVLQSSILSSLSVLLLHRLTLHSKPLLQNVFLLRRAISSRNITQSFPYTYFKCKHLFFRSSGISVNVPTQCKSVVKPVLKLGFETAENCTLDLSLRGVVGEGREKHCLVYE